MTVLLFHLTVSDDVSSSSDCTSNEYSHGKPKNSDVHSLEGKFWFIYHIQYFSSKIGSWIGIKILEQTLKVFSPPNVKLNSFQCTKNCISFNPIIKSQLWKIIPRLRNLDTRVELNRYKILNQVKRETSRQWWYGCIDTFYDSWCHARHHHRTTGQARCLDSSAKKKRRGLRWNRSSFSHDSIYEFLRVPSFKSLIFDECFKVFCILIVGFYW